MVRARCHRTSDAGARQTSPSSPETAVPTPLHATPLAGELVLQFRGRQVETEDEIAEIEAALFELLPDGDTVEGHEISPQARNILIDTRDAASALARVLPFLEQAGLAGALRVGARASDSELHVSLWPADCAFERS